MKNARRIFFGKRLAVSSSGGGPLDTNQLEVDLINGIGWHTIIILLPSDLWLEKFAAPAAITTAVQWNLEFSVAHVVLVLVVDIPRTTILGKCKMRLMMPKTNFTAAAASKVAPPPLLRFSCAVGPLPSRQEFFLSRKGEGNHQESWFSN